MPLKIQVIVETIAKQKISDKRSDEEKNQQLWCDMWRFIRRIYI